MSEKILLNESSKASRMRLRESNDKHENKTKIVVHINNYILANDDKNARPMSSRQTTATDLFELDFPKTEFRFNELNTLKKKTKSKEDNEYMILKAKSLNFPVKIRSSYTIYQSSNLADTNDKRLSMDKNYSLMENKISNLINYNMYTEIYKKLPGVGQQTTNADQANFNSLRQMFLREKVSHPSSLPNYLKPNMNLQPTYSIISKSKSDPKLSNPIFSYKKLINERNNNLVERFNKLEAFLKKREKKRRAALNKNSTDDSENSKKEIYTLEKNENEPLKEESQKTKNKPAKPSNIKTLEPPSNNKVLVYVESEPPRKVITTTDSFKLPYLMRSFDPNEFALSLTNHESSSQTYENFNEHSQLSNFNDDVDDKINKIIKSYPSIVLRRQGNRRFPKLKNYLTENHIKYDISHFKSNSTTAAATTTNKNVSTTASVTISKETPASNTTTETTK